MKREIRHVLRKLARAPLFTAVSILTLALGIGANTAIFSVVRGVLLKPLPFESPERLVGVWHQGFGFTGGLNQSPATYFTYREESTTFEDIGMWDNDSVSVTGLEEPGQVVAIYVTDGTLPILKVEPMLGRRFTPDDKLANNDPKRSGGKAQTVGREDIPHVERDRARRERGSGRRYRSRGPEERLCGRLRQERSRAPERQLSSGCSRGRKTPNPSGYRASSDSKHSR